MVRTVKSSPAAATAPAAPSSSSELKENVVVDAAAPVKAAKKERKAPKGKDLVAPEEVVVVETPATTDAPETEAPVEPSAEEKLAAFGAKLAALSAAISSARTEFKVVEKAIARELKAAKKSSSRKLKRAGNHKPSGFIRPTLISDELAEFLGKPLGTEMARTEVSKEINQYIRTNALQDKTNGRNINPDPKLFKLLNMSPTDSLSYFNLQRYMKTHFVRPATPVATA
jgi:chromatin remodeling complex protein RSC6